MIDKENESELVKNPSRRSFLEAGSTAPRYSCVRWIDSERTAAQGHPEG
jgi:hypothetical protein